MATKRIFRKLFVPDELPYLKEIKEKNKIWIVKPKHSVEGRSQTNRFIKVFLIVFSLSWSSVYFYFWISYITIEISNTTPKISIFPNKDTQIQLETPLEAKLRGKLGSYS